MAFLVQSAVTFEFLHASPRDGDVTWTPSLLTALRHGVIDGPEEVAQMVADHCDMGSAIVVDLDEEFRMRNGEG